MRNKKHCSGCYNDFYNSKGECWGLKSAKLVSRVIIGIDDMPPYDLKQVKVLSCWQGQRRRAYKGTQFTKDGYWW